MGGPRCSRESARRRAHDRDRVTICGVCAVSLALSVASLAISLATLIAVQ